MSSQHRLQESRFELKYIIDEQKARGIRDFARSYLEPDHFADINNNYSYPIHSLYLDNASFALCRATMNGLKNRFKLRIRYYDDNPAHPLFFEIKRRVTDAILKRRAAVRREALPRLLAGQWPEPTDLMDPTDLRAFDALKVFWDLQLQLKAVGQCIVSYVREAWVTAENNSIRLTFDRKLCTLPWEGKINTESFTRGRHPHVGGVILELKFTDRFPSWMREMVEVFNLRRGSMAKYVACVQELKPAQVFTEMGKFEALV